MGRSVRENISLSRLRLVSRLGWIAGIRERRAVSQLMKKTTVKAANMECPRRCCQAAINRSYSLPVRDVLALRADRRRADARR